MAYKICADIKENFVSEISFQNGPRLMLSLDDISIAHNWKLPCDISLPLTKWKASRDDVVWKAPLVGWVKVNFDGVAKGNPRPTGCGGVLRNSNGRFISVATLPLGTRTNHYAEVAATYHGLKMAHLKGYKKVWLEWESLNIINNMKKYFSPSLSVESIIMDAIKILNSFDEYYISHNFREGNGLADFFANLGVRGSREWDVNDPLPTEAISSINHDYQN